ncbi:MAG: aldehyde ferredoxin oxidoreductase C-terminal domain-containing protein, partial [Geobacter sp.]
RHTAGDLLTIGERIIAAERSFNQANGFSVADDRLPERFLSHATGMTKPLDREHFAEELQRYQRIRSGVQA